MRVREAGEGAQLSVMWILRDYSVPLSPCGVPKSLSTARCCEILTLSFRFHKQCVVEERFGAPPHALNNFSLGLVKEMTCAYFFLLLIFFRKMRALLSKMK